jgi:hypothetical protein
LQEPIVGEQEEQQQEEQQDEEVEDTMEKRTAMRRRKINVEFSSHGAYLTPNLII